MNIIEECFSDKEVQVKNFCLPVSSRCPPVENINETHTKGLQKSGHMNGVAM